ncbi:MAG: type II toxin-antitoxin system Phd/YefM family antitoxin [Caldilineaceae bacterium]
MTIVSVAEFQENFGYFQELAQHEPVMVTSNGGNSVVLLSAEEYAALKKLRYAYGGEIAEDFKQAVEQFMQEHDAVLEGLAR